jgi:hypothetical protein
MKFEGTQEQTKRLRVLAGFVLVSVHFFVFHKLPKWDLRSARMAYDSAVEDRRSVSHLGSLWKTKK